jgi:outer membrane protein assembly factor BamD
MRPCSALALVMLLAGGAACEGTRPPADASSLTYAADSRAAYLEAMEAFDAKNWEETRSKMEEVRRLFGYSPYAKLAELRLADIEFEQGKYSDATAAYRAFIRGHRADDNVEYARYRIAKGAFNDIGDTLLLPPAEERDQGNAEDAHRELKAFVERYPSSRFRVDAGYMYEVVAQRLVRHELFVARYYLREDNFAAALRRVDYALKKYPGSGLDAEALVLKGETLLRKHEPGEARAVFEAVVVEHGGPFGVVAKKFLAALPQAPAPDGTPGR